MSTPRTSRRPSRAAGWLIGHPWFMILAVATLALALWAKSTRTSDHEITAVFSDAVSVYKGLDVRVDGLDAGKVQGVTNENGQAVIKLGINDDVWPLHEGTTVALRFGTTVGNGTRILDVHPGPKSGRELPDGAIIPNANTIETTEFDDLFDTFNGKTRKHVQGMASGWAKTFGTRAAKLGEAVEQTAPGLDAVGGVAADLARNEPALRALVANTDRATRTIAARGSQLENLVTVAGATFATFARNTSGITASLDRMPGALREARRTLGTLSGSVDHLDALVTDLRPGAAQLAPLARALRPALHQLRDTAPAAVATFRAGRVAAPNLTKFLRRAQPFSDLAAPVFSRLAPMVGCLRPYAPEVAGLMSTWGSWAKGYDNAGHIGRVWANAGPASVTSTPQLDSGTYTKLTGQGFALVRPPGYNGGKPWFLPECGVGRDVLDPSKDPEDR